MTDTRLTDTSAKELVDTVAEHLVVQNRRAEIKSGRHTQDRKRQEQQTAELHDILGYSGLNSDANFSIPKETK